jgi:hypothetical protein
MPRTSLAFCGGWSLLLTVGCGSSFSSSSPDTDGSADEAARADSAPDGKGGTPEAGRADASGPEAGQVESGGAEGGGPAEAGGAEGTYCGPMLVCNGTGKQQGSVCCVPTASSPMYSCASSACGCGDTQLDCASDADCGGQHCCIENVTTSCSDGQFVASCQATCPVTAHRLCKPGGAKSECPVLGSCSTDTSAVGLPSSQGFGVCN